MATTPEHLWDTSSMTPPSGSTQGLSSTQGLLPAAPSPDNSMAAAFMPSTTSTSSAQRLKVASVGPAASSPAQAGASAGRRYLSSQHSLHAGSCSLILSGSPMAGLGRTGPQVRMTKKQQVRCWQQVLWVCGLCHMVTQLACWQATRESADPDMYCRFLPSLVNAVLSAQTALCRCTIASHRAY